VVNETARRLCLRLLAVHLKLESMKPIERVATSFIAFGFVLHTYEHAVEAEQFSVAFWLWSLSPYVAATIVLVRFQHAHAAVGALTVPILLDLMTFFSVFVGLRARRQASPCSSLRCGIS
jgi:hypothetical protein